MVHDGHLWTRRKPPGVDRAGLHPIGSARIPPLCLAFARRAPARARSAAPRANAGAAIDDVANRSAAALGRRSVDRATCLVRRNGDCRDRTRRHRLGRRRGVLQHRHDRLPGDPHRSLLRRADHHLHLPAHRQRRRQQRGHRDLQPRGPLGRARRRAARPDHRPVELSRRRASRQVAEDAGHHRHRRRRHARAHRAHSRAGHAQRRHRARAVGQVRHRQAESGSRRLAGPRRHGPRARRDQRPELFVGRDALGLGRRATGARRTRRSTSSPSTTA